MMAVHDWNGDGKKDFCDDFIEYQIYKDVTGDNDHASGSGGNGTCLVTILSAIVGFILPAILFTSLGIGVDSVIATVIYLILWFVCTIFCGIVLIKIGF